MNERIVDIDNDILTNIDITKKREITLGGHSVYVGKSGLLCNFSTYYYGQRETSSKKDTAQVDGFEYR